MYVVSKRLLKRAIPLSGMVMFIIYMLHIFSGTKPNVSDATALRDNTATNSTSHHITNIGTSSADSNTTREPALRSDDTSTTNTKPSPKGNSILTSPANSDTTHAPLYSDSVISPDLYDFTINNSNYCQSQNSSGPFLVILVKSNPIELFDRQLIRQTWGGTRDVDGNLTMTVFLLGLSENPNVNKLIQEESEHHHDIVQENFIDTYHNLTIKTLMGMKWVTMFCPNVSFVASADADVMLNTHNLVRRLRDKPRVGYAEGSLRTKGQPIKGKTSKWYTTKELYPESTYAPYFPGSCYVMSVDVASAVYRASEHVRFLPWDDVFVGLAMKRAGIEPKAAKGYEQYVNSNSDKSITTALKNGIAVLLRHQTKGVDKRLVTIWNSSI